VLPPDIRFAVSPSGCLVYRRSTGVVARVGIRESEVLRRFDGSSAEQIRERVESDRGLHLTREAVAAFGEHAFAVGLLERPGSAIERSARRQRLSWSVALWNPARLFDWCARHTSALFHPASIAAGLALIVFAGAVSFTSLETPNAPRIPGSQLIAVFFVVLNVVSILHECGHGITLHRFGAAAREVGVRFVLGWPCWYCDITESYLLPRRSQRVAVILAGPFVQAVVCAAIVLFAAGTAPQVVAMRRAAALLGFLNALNFFPLIRSDGYYLLAELAGMPNLRSEAWRWLTSSAARDRMWQNWSTRKWLAVAAYGLASAGFVALVLVRAVVVMAAAVASAHVSVRSLEALLSVLVIVSMLFRRRRS